jgi:nitroreductase
MIKAIQNTHIVIIIAALIGTVVFGAFRDDEVSKILNIPDEEQPLYILSVGKR